MKYYIKNESIAYNGYLKILKADIEFDSFTKDKRILATNREACHRGDSCAIVLYEKDTGKFIFTKQFRYPTTQHDDGWIMEIVAGNIEQNETPKQSAIKEIEEEVGYTVEDIEFINSFYMSPGRSTERIFLFYSEVSSDDKTKSGGGVDSEHEDILTLKFTIEEIKLKISNGEIIDAKTLIGLQYVLMKNQK